MPIGKPYKLIIRPFTNSLPSRFDYIRDKSRTTSFRAYIRAFALLEKDLQELFDYIEPTDNNKIVYSHRIYEMFLRACTEFESNAKFILKNNNYIKDDNSYNIIDYYKLNTAMKLNDYLIKINIWEGDNNIIAPFKEWSFGHSLEWYQDYNSVKHDRNTNFHLANLSNLVKAISAVRIILYAQYDFISFNCSCDTNTLNSPIEGFECKDTSILSVKFNGHWTDDEKYDFDWKELSLTEDPYQYYDFY